MNASGGKSNACAGEKREQAGDDHPADRDQHHHQHHDGEAADVFDVAPQQRRGDDAHRRGNQVVLERRHRRPDELQVVGEADRAAGDGERRDQDRLEDEQERHQPAEAERLEGFAKVEVAAAAAGQRRAELRIDETVGEREDETGDPRVDHVRAVHGGDHEGNSQEGTDADHRDDVGGGRLQQAHARSRGLGA